MILSVQTTTNSPLYKLSPQALTLTSTSMGTPHTASSHPDITHIPSCSSGGTDYTAYFNNYDTSQMLSMLARISGKE